MPENKESETDYKGPFGRGGEPWQGNETQRVRVDGNINLTN